MRSGCRRPSRPDRLQPRVRLRPRGPGRRTPPGHGASCAQPAPRDGPGAQIITPVVGDVLDADGLVELFRGCEAVVNATGSPEPGPAGRDVDRDGTAAVIRGMGTAGVRRLIHLSCMYAHRPADAPAAFAPVWAAKRNAEEAVKDSDLDWTIVRAGPLVDSGAAGQLSLAAHLDTLDPVSREDIAAVIGSCIAIKETTGHDFDVTGGTTYLLTALDVVTGRRPRSTR